jgi:hypothetical protein
MEEQAAARRAVRLAASMAVRPPLLAGLSAGAPLASAERRVQLAWVQRGR